MTKQMKYQLTEQGIALAKKDSDTTGYHIINNT